MNDSDITDAAIQEIAAILAAGYLRYRRTQLAGPSPIDPVDSAAAESVHGDEVIWIGTKGSSPETARFRPCSPQEVPAKVEELLKWWHEQHVTLRGVGKELIVGVLATFHYRFLHIHPFLDANGRVARVLLDQATRELLNMRMGQELVADSEAYIAALSAADEGDLIPLQRLVLASMQ